MAKRGSRLLLSVCLATLLAGCSTLAQGPVTALIVSDQKGPVAMGTAAGWSKVGRSEAWGILVFATGDASISAAMKAGGITRVHHVDNETMTILGIYAKYTTIVYGE
jgi:hypothetical protein